MSYFKEASQTLARMLFEHPTKHLGMEQMNTIEQFLKRVGIDTAMDTVLQAEAGWNLSNESLGLPHYNKSL